VTALILASSSAVYARRQIGQMLVEVGAALGIDTDAAPRAGRARKPRRPETATPATAAGTGPTTATLAPAPADKVVPPPVRPPRSDRSATRARVRPARVALVDPPVTVAAAVDPPAPPVVEAVDSPPSLAPPALPAPAHPLVPALAPPPLPAPATAASPSPWYPPAPVRAPVRPPSVLGAEARLVREALESLRRERQPAAALARLDEHRERFPRGLLRADADLLRVDALVALERRAEALALLESLPVPWSPRGAELQVLRGELRAAHSCRQARRDFDQVLAREVPAAVAERALRGRAICRINEAGASAATVELRAYLARFPAGPFAAQATKLLRRR
jgi:hypothetical protein